MKLQTATYYTKLLNFTCLILTVGSNVLRLWVLEIKAYLFSKS